MPEFEAVRKAAICGPHRRSILGVLSTAVSYLLWRIHQYRVLAAPLKLSVRAPAQSDKSSADVYYISPSHLYVSVHYIENPHLHQRGSFIMTGRHLDRYGAGCHFHRCKDSAAVSAQSTFVHKRLPHLHRSDLPFDLEHLIPSHVSANVRHRSRYARS